MTDEIRLLDDALSRAQTWENVAAHDSLSSAALISQLPGVASANVNAAPV